jgi:hypothetical protein
MLNTSVALDHAAHAEAIPLDEIDVSDPKLYHQDVWGPYYHGRSPGFAGEAVEV